MAKKKTNKNIPLPILILICAVLLFAMYLSLSTLALAIWGDSVMGTVDSYDSRRDDTTAQENRSRTVSKGYWFMANGKEYKGYVIYGSDEAWPSLDEGETRPARGLTTRSRGRRRGRGCSGSLDERGRRTRTARRRDERHDDRERREDDDDRPLSEVLQEIKRVRR